MRSNNVTQTNIQLTNLSDIFSSVQLGNFYRYLPPSVVKELDNKKDSREEGSQKKQKQVKAVTNENQIQNWKLRSNENWDRTFGGMKKAQANFPKLSVGCFPCLKWHVRGYCWSDCYDKKSHQILQGEDKKKVIDLIKRIREE